MAKRGGKNGGDTESERNAFLKRQRDALSILVGLWAGRRLPLGDLGIMWAPPWTEDQIRAEFADEIERGVAEQNQKLIGWLWDSAEEGNATVQMYLANHLLGWKGVPKTIKPPAQKTQPATAETTPERAPPAAPGADVLDMKELARRFRAPKS